MTMELVGIHRGRGRDWLLIQVIKVNRSLASAFGAIAISAVHEGLFIASNGEVANFQAIALTKKTSDRPLACEFQPIPAHR